jgi:predicted transcriptional regulator
MEQQEQSNIATSLHDVEELSLGKLSASKGLNYQVVHDLSAKGYSQRSIARTTGVGRAAVREYIDSNVCPFRKTPLRPVRLIKFKIQSQTLIENGVTGITDISRRLIDQGFDGSYDMVRRYLKSRFKSSPSTGKKVIRRLEVWSSRKTG